MSAVLEKLRNQRIQAEMDALKFERKLIEAKMEMRRLDWAIEHNELLDRIHESCVQLIAAATTWSEKQS